MSLDNNFFSKFLIQSEDPLHTNFNYFLKNLDGLFKELNDTKSINIENINKPSLNISENYKVANPASLYSSLLREIKKQDNKIDDTMKFKVLIKILKEKTYKFTRDFALKLFGLAWNNNTLEEFFKKLSNEDYNDFKTNFKNAFFIKISADDVFLKILPDDLQNALAVEINRTSLGVKCIVGSNNDYIVTYVLIDIIYNWVYIHKSPLLSIFSKTDITARLTDILLTVYSQIIDLVPKFNKTYNLDREGAQTLIDTEYKKFYDKYRKVYTHLKVRQNEKQKLYKIEYPQESKKLVLKNQFVNIENQKKIHTFGPFDSIFTEQSNNNDSNVHLNKTILSQLKNSPVCIIGLGQSGSGKTSTLIQLNGDASPQPGVLIDLLHRINDKSPNDFINITVTLNELLLNKEMYEKISDKDSFQKLFNKSEKDKIYSNSRENDNVVLNDIKHELRNQCIEYLRKDLKTIKPPSEKKLDLEQKISDKQIELSQLEEKIKNILVDIKENKRKIFQDHLNNSTRELENLNKEKENNTTNTKLVKQIEHKILKQQQQNNIWTKALLELENHSDNNNKIKKLENKINYNTKLKALNITDYNEKQLIQSKFDENNQYNINVEYCKNILEKKKQNVGRLWVTGKL